MYDFISNAKKSGTLKNKMKSLLKIFFTLCMIFLFFSINKLVHHYKKSYI